MCSNEVFMFFLRDYHDAKQQFHSSSGHSIHLTNAEGHVAHVLLIKWIWFEAARSNHRNIANNKKTIYVCQYCTELSGDLIWIPNHNSSRNSIQNTLWIQYSKQVQTYWYFRQCSNEPWIVCFVAANLRYVSNLYALQKCSLVIGSILIPYRSSSISYRCVLRPDQRTNHNTQTLIDTDIRRAYSLCIGRFNCTTYKYSSHKHVIKRMTPAGEHAWWTQSICVNARTQHTHKQRARVRLRNPLDPFGMYTNGMCVFV